MMRKMQIRFKLLWSTVQYFALCSVSCTFPWSHFNIFRATFTILRTESHILLCMIRRKYFAPWHICIWSRTRSILDEKIAELSRMPSCDWPTVCLHFTRQTCSSMQLYYVTLLRQCFCGARCCAVYCLCFSALYCTEIGKQILPV